MRIRIKIAKIIRCIVQQGRIAYYKVISDNLPSCNNIILTQPLFCTGSGRIELDRCTIGVLPSPKLWSGYIHIEARAPNASIKIGRDTWINNGAILIAERTYIRIDESCLIGPDLQIYDSDFHSIAPYERLSGNHICAPVHIHENVFLGSSVTVLKGVTIGRNSVIASGSVVIRDVPPNTLVAGVPARVIRSIEC
jgi:acetyltransferase-like isoleucine patch superfamily enzyme